MYQTSDIVDAPLADVWAWHTRPGVLQRLAPPWQPVRVDAEAGSLRDGAAVLTLPGGIRWVATHQADGYLPRRRFVDRLTSWPLASILAWRHEHLFSDIDVDRTEVTDRVHTRIPDRLLRTMFAYRQRQLADDLAAHRWASLLHTAPLTVAVTGSSGLVGTALCAMLTSGGHRVIRLVRREPSTGGERRWNPLDPHPDLLDGADALIHLAGEPITGRFDAGHKAAIRDSRIAPTDRLARLAARGGPGHPVALVCASAVGIYGPDRREEILTEDSERGDGFLADVVAAWEQAADPARQRGLRVVHVRTGIVQSAAGGSLRLLRLLFETGLGGRLGDGQQWTPWIGLDDLLDVYLRALVDPHLLGPVNAVAPEAVRNAAFSRVLARVLCRPAIVPVPSLGPRLLLGQEGAAELALAGQRAVPDRLTDMGHHFRFTTLEPALRHLLGRLP
ncbi:MAG TPA: TIGR01777 family oxidoreductase [Nakamurella sp.]